MSRTADQIALARKARNECARKLRRLGYKFAKKTVTEAETVAAIHRNTGWPLPGRGEAIDYLQRFASTPDGVPAPSRAHDALNAPSLQLSAAMRAAAQRAAQVQPRLIAAASKVDNWRLMGGSEA
ncbi:hypothetical protein NAT65_28940 [Achromobacter xylosoxidans]|uniref:hypothetical protein n=1 Tax=Alcaligenes xylosoxydans xylosoxydans TaxID=85698 RepID=UPI00203B7BD3|nr:hypothetical protein [Achromobacter xylosoxidans]MCM2575138.1 hypothetical protein [Achromobacter xylosoxidans]